VSQIFQTSYTQRNAEAFLGQITEAFNHHDGTTRVARGLVKSGYGVFRVPGVGFNGSSMLDPGECYQIPDPGLAADVDAIATGAVVKSSASAQTILAASCDGVVAGAEMQPGRKLTVICDSHTDWDATTGVIRYVSADTGQIVSENLSLATSASLTTTGYASQFVSLYIPAQTGAGGTATIGVAALTLAVTDFLGVALRQPIKQVISANGIYGLPGVTSTLVTADYVDSQSVPVLTAGGVWVYSETAVVEGDDVYVRKAAGTGTALGAFRNSSDSSTCVAVPGAKWTRSGAAGICRARFSSYGTV